MKKSITFNDFNKLLLKGLQSFISYGDYVVSNPKSTRQKRKLVIKYFYKNKK